jgi:serine O-acetyltransferase
MNLPKSTDPALVTDVWEEICREISDASMSEPVLASFYQAAVLNHATFSDAIGFHLANQLAADSLGAMTLRDVISQALDADPQIVAAMQRDLRAHRERDPACANFFMPFLYFKGFHALSSWRIAHWLWQQGRRPLALYFQNHISQVFGVDIHPGATIGDGIMIDHATGVVIGETAIIDNNVSMLHGVTLGGNGCAKTRRHPHVRQGVLIGVGAKLLGNIDIGEGAKIGAGSVVLMDVAPHTTVAGVPARLVGRPRQLEPSRDMDHNVHNDN